MQGNPKERRGQQNLLHNLDFGLHFFFFLVFGLILIRFFLLIGIISHLLQKDSSPFVSRCGFVQLLPPSFSAEEALHFCVFCVVLNGMNDQNKGG